MPYLGGRFFDASIDFVPGMNGEELKKGLPKAMAAMAAQARARAREGHSLVRDPPSIPVDIGMSGR